MKAKEFTQKLNEVAEADTVKKLSPLTDEELLRGLRLSVSGEAEAIKLYSQLAESCKNPKVKNILESISREEQVHIGEFLEAINIINPEESKAYDEGRKEARKNNA